MLGREMETLAQTLKPSEVAEWRSACRDAEQSVAVVCGRYAILQPGNLEVILTAGRQADRVLVVVTSDEERASGSTEGCPSVSERAGVVAHLADVDAVTAPAAVEVTDVLSDLQPYLLVTCPEYDQDDAWLEFAADKADRVVGINVFDGCRTRDVVEAMKHGPAPVGVPYEPRPDLYEIRRPASGSLVVVNGCFDVLHRGHLESLARARALGDWLLVLINDDASVQRFKGPDRPIFPVAFRRRSLESMRAVDSVTAFSEETPLDVLKTAKPDVLAKGGSYEEERVRAERELIAQWGGTIEFLPMIGSLSTSGVISNAAGRS